MKGGCTTARGEKKDQAEHVGETTFGVYENLPAQRATQEMGHAAHGPGAEGVLHTCMAARLRIHIYLPPLDNLPAAGGERVISL